MPKCPICETKVSKHIETYKSDFNNQEYKLYHCPNCDLQWWEPLQMIPEFYENEVFDMYKNWHLGYRSYLSYYQEYFLKKTHLVKKGKLLDVGCADGIFLEYAKKYGFEVYGLDLDKKSVNIARKRIGTTKIFHSDLHNFIEYAKSINLKFDVITFFEVLEHQDEPLKFMTDIKEILSPQGFIAGSVPYRDSPFIKRVEQKTYVDNPPHHFLRFSKKAIKFLLEKFEFDILEISIPTPSLEEISWLVQEAFLREISSFFKKHILKDTNLSKDTIQNSYLRVNYLKTLRTIILGPLGFLFFWRKWPHIFFLAKLK